MAVTSFPFSQPIGTQVYGPVTIADNLTRVKLSLTNWPQAGRTVASSIEISMDGGANWSTMVSMNPTGGARTVGRDGTTDCSMSVGPLPDGTGRQLRARVTVAGGTVSSTLTITTS